MSRFDQFLDFLLSPAALLLLLVGAIFFTQALKHVWVRWALFGGMMYIASMSKFYDEWEERFWDPFNAPVEMLVVNGRPLAVIQLFALICLAILTVRFSGRAKVPAMMAPIHAMQCLVLFKVFEGNGLSPYVIQAAAIFVFIGVLTAFGLRDWARQANPVEMFMIALCVAGGLFALISFWHLFTNPSAIMRQGRLMGTTGNPQHAAVLLGLCSLGPAYVLATLRERKKWQLIGAVLLAFALLYLLLLTGSRTGIGLVLVGAFFLFRGRIGAAAIAGGFVAAVVFVVLQQYGEEAGVERLASVEDTRSVVWRQQWETFNRYPVFGAPQRGTQFRSAENSWLGLLAAAGVFGGMCLAWLLYEYGRMASALWRLRKWPELSLQVNFCLAGIATVLAGSFFEAYLFGIITFPVLFIAALSVVCEHTVQLAYANPGYGQVYWQPQGRVMHTLPHDPMRMRERR